MNYLQLRPHTAIDLSTVSAAENQMPVCKKLEQRQRQPFHVGNDYGSVVHHRNMKKSAQEEFCAYMKALAKIFN